MQNLVLEIINDSDIEQCRPLCEELMAFQKSKAFIHPEWFDLMNFDTRMKKVHEHSPRKQIILAKDNGEAVGYVFSTIDIVEESHRKRFPDWAPGVDKNSMGFFPDWLELPQKVGCLRNLYLRDKFKGSGIGSKMTKMAMEWIDSFGDVKTTLVFISNGNSEALKFYQSHGFKISHEVFGGFITAVYK